MARVACGFGDSMADEDEVRHLGRPVSAMGAQLAHQPHRQVVLLSRVPPRRRMFQQSPCRHRHSLAFKLEVLQEDQSGSYTASTTRRVRGRSLI